MGWCSGTEIFDVVAEAVLEDLPKEEVLGRLIDILEDHDWDCQCDSEFWTHPVVRKLFEDRYPEWFEDEE